MEMGAGGTPPPGGGQYGQQPGYGQQPPGGYPPQQQQQPYGGGGGGGGGGVGDMATQVQRAVRTPETKPFFLTSEFLVWLVAVIALFIAGAATGDDNGDDLPASLVWILFTVISFAYIISRGISKAGAKYGGGARGRGGQDW
jgi:hypothetical protein